MFGLALRRVPAAASILTRHASSLISIRNGLKPSVPMAVNGLAMGNSAPTALSAVGMDAPIHQQQQVRLVTKKRLWRFAKRKKREEMALKGIPIPKPNRYIPRDTPVKNARTREEVAADSKRQDEIAAAEMKAKMEIIKDQPLRFGFLDERIKMSDRVRMLFDLHNGNQREVVKAQKMRGMELFQLREGDTGSSAVQAIALTTRIQQVQTHLRVHKKDMHSKRGLTALIVRRRKVLDYMERKDFESYRKVVKTLGLGR